MREKDPYIGIMKQKYYLLLDPLPPVEAPLAPLMTCPLAATNNMKHVK
jgi:hypothetical protein